MPRRFVRFNRNWTSSARLASGKLFDTLLAIYGGCKRMSSKDLCILAHYAVRAGVPGANFRRIALPPGCQTGRYSKYLKRQFPKGGPFYRAQIPVHMKEDPSIKSRDVIFKTIYHAVSREFAETPWLADVLKRGGADNFDSVMSLP
eukprot:9490836-Pyramimonas_sp.AAC.1